MPVLRRRRRRLSIKAHVCCTVLLLLRLLLLLKRRLLLPAFSIMLRQLLLLLLWRFLRLRLLLRLLLLLPLLLPEGRQCCVELVAQQGATHSRHLGPDLVGAPRHQLQGGLMRVRAPLLGSTPRQAHLLHLQGQKPVQPNVQLE